MQQPTPTDFGIWVNGKPVTAHKFKNPLLLEIQEPTLSSQAAAARFFPMAWDRYVELPGSPRYTDPALNQLSKADVFVNYVHSRLLEAIIEEKSSEQNS